MIKKNKTQKGAVMTYWTLPHFWWSVS